MQGKTNITMLKSKNVDDAFQCVEIIFKTSLICLGVYLFYVGDCLSKFQMQRTNFAQFSEAITELPTLYTWIEYSDYSKRRLEIGQDFNITYWTSNRENNDDDDEEEGGKILEFGSNEINGTKLEMEIEELEYQVG